MPKRYDISKRSDLRRWANDTAKEINKELDRAFKREARRRPATLPVEVSSSPQLSAGPRASWGGPPQVVNNITNIHTDGQGNQVAVGVEGDVHQQSVVMGMSAQDLTTLISQLRQVKSELNLSPEDAIEYAETVDRIEQEAHSDTPNQGRLRRALNSAGDFLRAGGGEAAVALIPVVAAAASALG